MCTREIFNKGEFNMADNTGFVDPLENIINKTKEVYGIPNDEPTPTTATVEPPVDNTAEPMSTFERPIQPSYNPTPNYIQPPVEEVEDDEIEEEQVNDYNDDDEYGTNDLQRQIEEEDRQREAEREARIQARREEEAKFNRPKQAMPPRSLDQDFQREAVGHQGNNLAIVTGMIEKVKAKYHLVGFIPKEKQRYLEGDLLEYFMYNGDTITPEFEQMILKNWQHVDPETGEVYANSQPNQNDNEKPNNQQAEAANITINVEPNTDVTVNIDGEKLEELTKTNVINVRVREVTDEDMRSTTIIENPQDLGIIKPYESNLNDVPITLPMSGYRCVIKPINWFETIDLLAPTSNSKIDFQIQRWSIIYNHIKNVSIGDFKDFDDFLKKTKYADLPILEWAILVATGDEEEPLDFTCGNPKCKKHYQYRYIPRTIIHLNEERIPKKYRKVANATGPSAIQLFNEINSKRKRYQLPKTGMIVEMNEPSAYEYINKILPLVIEKYTEKRPDDPDMENFNEETLQGDPTLVNFSYRIAMMMRISAISIPDTQQPNREYRFTNWDDIEKCIDSIRDMTESMLVVKLCMESRDMADVAEFYLENVQCPHCGRTDKKIPITNITQTLLFRISRRLENMEVNLIPLD